MQPTVAKYPFTNLQRVLLGMLLLADGLFFSLVNPQQGRALVVVSGTALVAVSIYALCWVVVHSLQILLQFQPSTERLLTFTFAGPLVYGLLMQSIGQLNLRDILAIIPITLIAYFYFAYGHSSQSKGS